MGEPFDMKHVSDKSGHKEDEPVTGRVLLELIVGDMIVLPVSESGEIDPVFYALDRLGSEVLDKRYFSSKCLKLIEPKRPLTG